MDGNEVLPRDPSQACRREPTATRVAQGILTRALRARALAEALGPRPGPGSSAWTGSMPWSWLPLPRAARIELRSGAQLAGWTRFRKRFWATEIQWRQKAADLQTISDRQFFADLALLLRDFYLPAEAMFLKSLFAAGLAHVSFRLAGRRLESAYGVAADPLRLLAGLGGVRRMDLHRDLRVLFECARKEGTVSERFRTDLEFFLERNYHHAFDESGLDGPRWPEDPPAVRELIEAMLDARARPADPFAAVARQEEDFVRARAELRRRMRVFGLRGIAARRRFEARLRRVRAWLVAREEARDFAVRARALARAYVLEAGRRLRRAGCLTDPAEVFSLTDEELLAICRKLPWPHEVNELRRRLAERTAAARPTVPAAIPPRSSGPRPAFHHGIPARPGVLEGFARVVTSLEQIEEIEPGEIVVVRSLSAAWTPLLGMAAAVIGETGGALSQAAVLAREHGVPAVLSVTGATELIRTGDLLRVDGGRGVVQLLRAVEGARDRGLRLEGRMPSPDGAHQAPMPRRAPTGGSTGLDV